ncbi:Taurine dioxygenase, alpha-ketoglutarate-dependent [Micromonospora haikouensis]|uniref:Taurine dioxygenase, alpha-ketoglutarate-dependent n=1 Tax=Micromonospora haikouensis TaxID=686309 RepID=A0A1C4XHB3_9ACTN|nr:TauD/TfdA family dioxygenase [Micromonospora haikouensis]SCF07766.1 Taurine dioxygenase, alpha-ketoglutarate-dependent [Micromonospora haikouensis]
MGDLASSSVDGPPTGGARGPVAGQRRRRVDRTTADPWGVVEHRAPAGYGLPVELATTRPGTSLAGYAAAHSGELRARLHQAGAILFRGFGVTLDSFGDVATALAGPRRPYTERSTPRTELAERVYTATDHPSDQHIPLHNENSYQSTFPRLLVFGCLTAPATGGATPLADVRRVLRRIPPAVRRPFVDLGVTYLRTFGGGLGLDWPEAFGTRDRAEVERYCRDHDIEVRWRPGGVLRTRQTRPAVAVHPVTGEQVWFNHATFFHPHTLPPELRVALVSQVGADYLPHDVHYGDGRPIDPGTRDVLAAAYAAEEVSVPWQVGDVLLVDNLLAAHGRQPFTGPRRVVVGMAGEAGWDLVDARIAAGRTRPEDEPEERQ